MVRFVLGLIVGAFLGAAAVASSPGLSVEVREAVANLTALVATGAERAAESVEQGAGKLADEANQAEPSAPAAGQASPPADPASP